MLKILPGILSDVIVLMHVFNTVVTIVLLLFPPLYSKRGIITRSPCSWVRCPTSFICYHVCLPRFVFLVCLSSVYLKPVNYVENAMP